MPRKTKVRREWTATEIHKLKGLAEKKVGVDKIARTLKKDGCSNGCQSFGAGRVP
jgi:hypothetical protein